MLRFRGKLLKRVRQAGALILNAAKHFRFSNPFNQARARPASRFTQFKYLGDYMSLSLSTSERWRALLGHHERFAALGGVVAQMADCPDGLLIWEESEGHGDPLPLCITLEPPQLAPMEGELQLRFTAGGRTLFTLTFLLAPASLFGIAEETVIFIGGVQGGVDCRLEMRQAAKRNGEIAPAAMLLLTVRAFAAALGIGTILAVSEDDQIARGYASDKMKLDYTDFWTQAGGLRRGSYYVLAPEGVERPLQEIPISHRRRTKQKRNRRDIHRQAIESRLRYLLAQQPRSSEGRRANSRLFPAKLIEHHSTADVSRPSVRRANLVCIALVLLAAAAIYHALTLTPEEQQRARENREQVEREIEK